MSDGRPTPALMQIEDLLSRPGRTPITDGEQQWARLLTELVRAIGLPAWPIHRANDFELVVIAPDDLAVSA